jgi:hypothetical protein
MAYQEPKKPKHEELPDWLELYQNSPRYCFKILLQAHVGMKTIRTVIGRTHEQMLIDLMFYTTNKETKEKTLDELQFKAFVKKYRAVGRATLQVWTYCQAESSFASAMAMRAEIRRRGDTVGAGQVSESVSKEIAMMSDEELLEKFLSAKKREDSEATKLKKAAKAIH